MYQYHAIAEDVHDGDTFNAAVDLGFGVWFKIKCRIHNIDAIELKDPGGIEARDFLIDLIQGHGIVFPMLTIQSYKDEQSFARWVCDVWLPDGRIVAQEIYKAGHNKPGTKWVPEGV